MDQVQTSNTSASASFPLKVSASRRYLIDQNDVPTLIHGDTAWSLFTGLTRDEVEQYLDDRQQKGFNSIIVNLVEHKFNGPENRYGEGPFRVTGDFSTPNEAYFAHADWCMEQAAERGIQVLLAPIYLGYPHSDDDDGWYHEALAAGVATCREWGRYVGKRYGRFDNLMWLMGGDRNPGAALDHVDAVAEGIKECDDHHLFTAHTLPEHTPAIEYARGGWLDVNTTYTYSIVHAKLLADYSRTPTMPFYLIESTYEGNHPGYPSGMLNASPAQLRRQAYWANLCGGCGQFFGNCPIWMFDPGWQDVLDAQGSRDMVRVKALFESRDWYKLVPDVKHTTVIHGLGEFRGMTYLSAARTADGGTIIAYMPTARTITVDLVQVSGDRARTWWFDPRTGEAQFSGEFKTDGLQRFWPPADGDWALVLDDAARNLPAPGTPDRKAC